MWLNGCKRQDKHRVLDKDGGIRNYYVFYFFKYKEYCLEHSRRKSYYLHKMLGQEIQHVRKIGIKLRKG